MLNEENVEEIVGILQEIDYANLVSAASRIIIFLQAQLSFCLNSKKAEFS